MTRLIFVRHGQSAANFDRIFAGHTDVPLTDLGRRQAHAAGEYLRRFRIDVAYASDLHRAYDTAAIVAAYHGLIPIPDPAFREIYAGDWEGRRFDDLMVEYPGEYATVWRTDIGHVQTPHGESTLSLAARVSAGVQRLLQAHAGKTVLIGTHATPIRMMECLWRGFPATEAAKIEWTQNASTTVVEYDGMRPRILLRGYDGYLGRLTTGFPANV